MLKATFNIMIASLLLAAALAAPAFADGGISVTQVWGRATPGNVPTGALYLTITNKGAAPDHLVGASTPAAKQAELHQMIMNNGVMEMRPVPSLEIMPGKSLVLAPNGYHVMLTGLKAPLKEGQSVPLTLTFEKAGTVKVTAKIAKVGAMHPDDQSGASGTSAMPGMSGGSGSMNMPGMH